MVYACHRNEKKTKGYEMLLELFRNGAVLTFAFMQSSLTSFVLSQSFIGTNTCGLCEPGLLKNDQIVISGSNDYLSTGKISKETLRRKNLRNMKKQYGIFDVGSF